MTRMTTNFLRSFLDSGLPPFLREGWPFQWVVRLWLGPNSLPDFKWRAFQMSDGEFIAAYKALTGLYSNRASDTTDRQAEWVLDHLEPARTILEIGPGRGTLTARLAASGRRVITLDLDHTGARPIPAVIGLTERLPFSDKSVDATVALHTIEHVRSLTRAFLELERVTRDRVLIITPRQRFYKITFDYHLHFFYSVHHLASHINAGSGDGEVIDGDLCLLWRLEG
jgi:ubiquinone/menaquinone biosynthesis C-methylase UbiE